MDFATGSLYALRVPHLLPALKDKEYQLSHLGELKVGNRAALGLQVTRKGRKDVSLFFDKENGLPLKTEVRLTDPTGQEMTLEYHYGDYKEFDGLKVFTKLTFKANDKDVRTELSEVQAQESLDDSTFGKP
jgi:outer membrane lipoprotein-sorting protein